jgi:hypothetical protein
MGTSHNLGNFALLYIDIMRSERPTKPGTFSYKPHTVCFFPGASRKSFTPSANHLFFNLLFLGLTQKWYLV